MARGFTTIALIDFCPANLDNWIGSIDLRYLVKGLIQKDVLASLRLPDDERLKELVVQKIIRVVGRVQVE